MTVGTESNQKTWYLPKKVLTHCSPFFDAALNGNFAEASSKAVDLPEDDPAAFEIWATWVSLGRCHDLCEHYGYGHSYVRAWVLGDKLACPAFKDQVMFLLLDWYKSGEDLQLDTIYTVYEVCSPSSKIRQFFVDWFVWYKLNGWLADSKEKTIALLTELPEFLKDVLEVELKAHRDIIPDPSKHKYRYYENPAFNPYT